MKAKPRNIDEYLAALPAERRAALEKLRRTILAAAPGAVECISYGIPAFRIQGRVLLFFAAATRHLSFFPGADPVRLLRAELTGYSTSKGTIRFSPERPLPAALVKQLVKARVAGQAPVVAKARARKNARARTRR